MTKETCKRFASSCRSEPISLLPLDNLVPSPCEMDDSAKSMSLNLTVEDRDKSAKPDMAWKNKDSACKTHVLVGSGVSKRTVCVHWLESARDVKATFPTKFLCIRCDGAEAAGWCEVSRGGWRVL